MKNGICSLLPAKAIIRHDDIWHSLALHCLSYECELDLVNYMHTHAHLFEYTSHGPN